MIANFRICGHTPCCIISLIRLVRHGAIVLFVNIFRTSVESPPGPAAILVFKNLMMYFISFSVFGGSYMVAMPLMKVEGCSDIFTDSSVRVVFAKYFCNNFMLFRYTFNAVEDYNNFLFILASYFTYGFRLNVMHCHLFFKNIFVCIRLFSTFLKFLKL